MHRTQIKQLFSARRLTVIEFCVLSPESCIQLPKLNEQIGDVAFSFKINVDETIAMRIMCRKEWKKTEHQVSLMRFVCAAACSGLRSNNEIRSINAETAFARIRWPNRRWSLNICILLAPIPYHCRRRTDERAFDRRVPVVFDSLAQ